MAAQGFLPTHLKYVRGLYSKGQFITGMAKTLKGSESLSNAMGYETPLEMATRRPQPVGLLTRNTLHNTKRRKYPVSPWILLPNLILRSRAVTNPSFLKDSSKIFVVADAIWLCQKAEELLCLADV